MFCCAHWVRTFTGRSVLFWAVAKRVGCINAWGILAVAAGTVATRRDAGPVFCGGCSGSPHLRRGGGGLSSSASVLVSPTAAWGVLYCFSSARQAGYSFRQLQYRHLPLPLGECIYFVCWWYSAICLLHVSNCICAFLSSCVREYEQYSPVLLSNGSFSDPVHSATVIGQFSGTAIQCCCIW